MRESFRTATGWVAALALAVGAPAARAQDVRSVAKGRIQVEIRVNGSAAGGGVALRGIATRVPGGDPAVLVAVAELRRAVDGDGARPRSRLRRDGRSLYAVIDGSCRSCTLRVLRPVRISRQVQELDGDAYLPLEDLVRALEGRVVADLPRGLYTVHVGTCHWCVLEPVGG